MTRQIMIFTENTIKGRDNFVHASTHEYIPERGMVCVERLVLKHVAWIPLYKQDSYTQWDGCFSIL
jgi:hypothetical protein